MLLHLQLPLPSNANQDHPLNPADLPHIPYTQPRQLLQMPRRKSRPIRPPPFLIARRKESVPRLLSNSLQNSRLSFRDLDSGRRN